MKNKFKDLTGKKFGQLTVLSQMAINGVYVNQWHTVCICGIKKNCKGADLLRGHDKSCGNKNHKGFLRIKTVQVKTSDSYAKPERKYVKKQPDEIMVPLSHVMIIVQKVWDLKVKK